MQKQQEVANSVSDYELKFTLDIDPRRETGNWTSATNVAAPNYFSSSVVLPSLNDISNIHAVLPMETAYLTPRWSTGSQLHSLDSESCPATSSKKGARPRDLDSNLGHPGSIDCSHFHLSLDTLRRKQWCAFDKGTLVERILQPLKISGIGPMCLSQQYETQQDRSNNVIYVHGSWLRIVYFKILASHMGCDQDFSSL